MKNKNLNFEIDLVYLWVDSADPEWQRKKNLMLVKENRPAQELKGRYENNDELKYSLRSVEKYAPWIRHIYIVTDNQIPGWLDLNNSKISIIDHQDILPQEALPCFNSGVIEYFIYKIPGLSEHFLFANDDMFFYKNVSPDFFFKDDGYPYIMLSFKLFKKLEDLSKFLLKRPKSNYKHGVDNATKLVWKKQRRRYIGVTHHNIDGYRKDDFKNIVEKEYHEELKNMYHNHFRMPTDIQRFLISLHLLSVKHGHLKYVSRKESLRLKVHKSKFKETINKYNPFLFCVNDNEHVSDEDRAKIKPFLESLFNAKSSFEV